MGAYRPADAEHRSRTSTLRFLHALSRFTKGLELQHNRIRDRTANAPRLLAGTECEAADLRGDPGSDVDYYVYELARLQDLARAVNKAFDEPEATVGALASFDAAIPKLREIRNPLTHASDDKRLDDVAWFDAVMRLEAGGSAEYLVDPRYQHHDAARALGQALQTYLESTDVAAIAAAAR